MVAKQKALFFGIAFLAVTALIASRQAEKGSRGDLPYPAQRFEVLLDASQVVPPNQSAGTGTGTLAQKGKRIHVSLSWEGLSGPITGAHIHGPAGRGENAGIVFDIVPGSRPAGSRGPLEATFDLKAEERSLLVEGRLYADIHTALNPGGEIRGQITKVQRLD